MCTAAASPSHHYAMATASNCVTPPATGGGPIILPGSMLVPHPPTCQPLPSNLITSNTTAKAGFMNGQSSGCCTQPSTSSGIMSNDMCSMPMNPGLKNGYGMAAGGMHTPVGATGLGVMPNGSDGLPFYCGSNANVLFVFTTSLANEAAQFVKGNQASSIIEHHRKQPATIRFLKYNKLSHLSPGTNLPNPTICQQQQAQSANGRGNMRPNSSNGGMPPNHSSTPLGQPAPISHRGMSVGASMVPMNYNGPQQQQASMMGAGISRTHSISSDALSPSNGSVGPPPRPASQGKSMSSKPATPRSAAALHPIPSPKSVGGGGRDPHSLSLASPLSVPTMQPVASPMALQQPMTPNSCSVPTPRTPLNAPHGGASTAPIIGNIPTGFDTNPQNVGFSFSNAPTAPLTPSDSSVNVQNTFKTQQQEQSPYTPISCPNSVGSVVDKRQDPLANLTAMTEDPSLYNSVPPMKQQRMNNMGPDKNMNCGPQVGPNALTMNSRYTINPMLNGMMGHDPNMQSMCGMEPDHGKSSREIKLQQLEKLGQQFGVEMPKGDDGNLNMPPAYDGGDMPPYMQFGGPRPQGQMVGMMGGPMGMRPGMMPPGHGMQPHGMDERSQAEWKHLVLQHEYEQNKGKGGMGMPASMIGPEGQMMLGGPPQMMSGMRPMSGGPPRGHHPSMQFPPEMMGAFGPGGPGGQRMMMIPGHPGSFHPVGPAGAMMALPATVQAGNQTTKPARKNNRKKNNANNSQAATSSTSVTQQMIPNTSVGMNMGRGGAPMMGPMGGMGMQGAVPQAMHHMGGPPMYHGMPPAGYMQMQQQQGGGMLPHPQSFDDLSGFPSAMQGSNPSMMSMAQQQQQQQQRVSGMTNVPIQMRSNPMGGQMIPPAQSLTPVSQSPMPDSSQAMLTDFSELGDFSQGFCDTVLSDFATSDGNTDFNFLNDNNLQPTMQCQTQPNVNPPISMMNLNKPPFSLNPGSQAFDLNMQRVAMKPTSGMPQQPGMQSGGMAPPGGPMPGGPQHNSQHYSSNGMPPFSSGPAPGQMVNNTYVNATMTIQQMNIQNVGPNPFPGNGGPPSNVSMNFQQMNTQNVAQAQNMYPPGASSAGPYGGPDGGTIPMGPPGASSMSQMASMGRQQQHQRFMGPTAEPITDMNLENKVPSQKHCYLPDNASQQASNPSSMTSSRLARLPVDMQAQGLGQPPMNMVHGSIFGAGGGPVGVRTPDIQFGSGPSGIPPGMAASAEFSSATDVEGFFDSIGIGVPSGGPGPVVSDSTQQQQQQQHFSMQAHQQQTIAMQQNGAHQNYNFQQQQQLFSQHSIGGGGGGRRQKAQPPQMSWNGQPQPPRFLAE